MVMRLNRVVEDFNTLRGLKSTYEGSRYAEVTHDLVHDTIYDYLVKVGSTPVSTKFLTCGDGQKLIGIFNLGKIDDELSYSLAWKNSLDGTMSFNIVGGTIVNVCSNTNISGDLLGYKRKHTGDAVIDIVENVKFSLDHLSEIAADHKLKMEASKNITLRNDDKAKILGNLFLYDNILNSNQLSIVKKELEEPTFSYSGKADSVWELYNYCTHAIKDCHPTDYIKKHKQLFNKMLL